MRAASWRTLKEFQRHAVGIFGIEAAHVARDLNDFLRDFHVTALPRPACLKLYDAKYNRDGHSAGD